MCGREITCMYLQRNDISIEIARPKGAQGSVSRSAERDLRNFLKKVP